MNAIFSKLSFTAILLGLFISTSALADGPVVKGTGVLGFGFGPGHRYYGGVGGAFLPALKINYEHGLWNAGPGTITLGGTTGLSFGSYRYGYLYSNYRWVYLTMPLAMRSAWHHNWGVDKLDTYGGVTGGIALTFINTNGDPYTSNHTNIYPVYGVFAGAAYYVKPHFGFFAEFGFGITWATIGMNIKFGGE